MENRPKLTRRDFLLRVGAATAAGFGLSALDALAGDPALALPVRGPQTARPLRVLPVLTYALPRRREATSWRSWGGIQTEQDLSAEKQRIGDELAKLKSR
jgi:hypothetical protein